MSFPLRRKLAGALLSVGGARDYWHPWLPPSGAREAGCAGPYFLDFEAKVSHPGPFDDAGLPLTTYGGKTGVQHYPIDICQFGLGHHSRWLRTGDPENRRRVLQVADWLVDRQQPLGSNSARAWWPAMFSWGGLPAPWPSGMAQGQAVSLLVRAFGLSGRDHYLAAASRGAEVLRVPIEQGGVARELNGVLVLEEFPGIRPSAILNGHVFAWWGLADLVAAAPGERVLELYERVRREFASLIPRYDLGFWSRYDLVPGRLPNPCSAFYQELHVHLMEACSALTSDAHFAIYAKRWRFQLERRSSRLAALLFKVVHRVSQ